MKDRASGLAAGGDLLRLRRLINLTVVATLALIVIGGVVRVSDSGLGCGPEGSGTEGWPLCGGRVLPLIEENALVEFSHRAAAAVVVVLIALIVWRVRALGAAASPLLRRGSIFAIALVLGQAALGGLTVEQGLEDELVAAHLGLAMVLLGTLLALAWAARPEPRKARAPAGARGLRPLAAAAAVLVLATIVAGGYVAGTEEEGVRNGAANGAHLACGEQFPRCLNDGVLPFGEHGRLADIQLTHRALVYVTSLTILLLLGLALYRRAFTRELGLLAALLVVQFTLGALNVWLGKHPTLIVAHLTAGTFLFAASVATVLRFAPVSLPRSVPGAQQAERAPAPA
jgi:heme A synthase